MIRFDIPANRDTLAKLDINDARRDHFMLFDGTAEFCDYIAQKHGSARKMQEYMDRDFCRLSGRDTLDRLRNGDLSGVAASDALLAKFEHFAFKTTRSQWRHDVAGAVCDVPALLAGQPLTMKRRAPQRDASNPLAVVCDLTSSASVTPDALQRRGAAILALVRILAARRPVELWAGMMTDAKGSGQGRDCLSMFFKIDTAPMDLARAAFAMTEASVCRRMFSAIGEHEYNRGGFFAYGAMGKARPYMAEIIAPAFTHVSQILALPSIHGKDGGVDNPEKWIEERLADAAQQFATAA